MPDDLGSRPGQMSSVVVFNTATLLVGPSPKRYGLIIVPPQTGRVTLGTSAGVTLDNGPTITTSGGPLALLYNEIGDVIRGQIWAVGSGASQAVGFIECLYG